MNKTCPHGEQYVACDRCELAMNIDYGARLTEASNARDDALRRLEAARTLLRRAFDTSLDNVDDQIASQMASVVESDRYITGSGGESPSGVVETPLLK